MRAHIAGARGWRCERVKSQKSYIKTQENAFFKKIVLNFIVPLHRILKNMKLGLVAIGGAILNYRKAKAEYEELMERKESIEAVVQSYNFGKYDQYFQSQEDKNELPDGLQVSTLLRISNITGKLMNTRGSVVFTNTGDKVITIKGIECQYEILDYPVLIYKIVKQWMNVHEEKVPQNISRTFSVAPGQTISLQFDGGVSSLADKMGELRELVRQAQGGSVLISKKVNIEDGQKSDIKGVWVDEDSKEHEFTMIGLPGVLRYCGVGSL